MSSRVSDATFASRFTRTGVFKRTGALALGLSVAAAGVVLPATSAYAAPDVITVTTTDFDGAGSFKEALETANASTNADGVEIEFAASLDGTGPITLNAVPVAQNMHTTRLGAVGGNHPGTVGVYGARFMIDADVPVSVNFANLDGITDADFSDSAGIYVASDNVTLTGLADMRASAAGIAISGTEVSVTNSSITDPSSPIQEIGVALLNGASNVTLRNLELYSNWFASIMIDGSLNDAEKVSVSNILVDNVTSRGVDSGFGHVVIEDKTTVNNLTVRNSTFGAVGESATSHGIYFNTAMDINGLTYTNNTVQRGTGAEMNVFYFENSTNSTFDDVIVNNNTFQGVSIAQPLSRIVGDNNGTWDNLRYTKNRAEFTRGIRMSGTVQNSLFDDNEFLNTREPSDAGITLGLVTDNVTVSNNLLDTVWAHDAIRVEGTSANDVTIENNTIHDFYADISRSAIRIAANGTDNKIRGNELVQDLSRAGVDLPAHMFNHWAIYNSESAATADASVGWSITENHIDGFGGNTGAAPLSQAPIVHNAIGKLAVQGNTFGPNVRGSFDPVTEHGPNHFFWNVFDNNSNNTVQTYRATSVNFTGDDAYFTATRPNNELGNNTAAGPVNLLVYWTAADHAEEYLGALTNVTVGQRVSIPTTHTNGNIRVQTVDASGNTSQYSSIDTNVTNVPEGPANPGEPGDKPAAPQVNDVTKDEVSGTGTPGADLTVRDADDEEVAHGTVDGDGNWAIDISDLQCDADFTVTQTVAGEESDPTAFSTVECGDGAGGTGGKKLDRTDAAIAGGLLLAALAMMGAGAGIVARKRRREI